MFSVPQNYYQENLQISCQIPPYNKQMLIHPEIPYETFPEPYPFIQQTGTQTELSLKPTERLRRKVSVTEAIDTSLFTVEERLVASVWVHERNKTRLSIGQIKKDFKARFNKNAPMRSTLLAWEKKIFKTGSVMDAARSGRPLTRRKHLDSVKESVTTSPVMSLRERAIALSLPRTTLRKILRDDLKVEKNITKKKSELIKTIKKRTRTPSPGKQILKRIKEIKDTKHCQQIACDLNQPESKNFSEQRLTFHQLPPCAYRCEIKHPDYSTVPFTSYGVTNVYANPMSSS